MKYVREMEKRVFEIMKDDRRTYPNRKRGSEWYITTMTRVKSAFKAVHKASLKEGGQYNYTLPPKFDFENAFVNVYNVEGKTAAGKSMRKISGYKK